MKSDAQNSLLRARREAAESITWPERTALLLNPDPTVRRRLKRFAFVVGAFALLSLISIQPHGPLQDLTDALQTRDLRPAMEQAMRGGNHTAATWLATHYPKEHPGLLQQQADAGNPKAMFLVGGYLMMTKETDGRYVSVDPTLTPAQRHAKGLELVRKAAAAGSEDALLFLIRNGEGLTE
ncbi:hypothetical protein [Cupriavidus nantongensis]|uniref:Uncharacterized protein n=1 Tax=Cupriavidus nantongensis TaxID=1796606 RepID=A0A142JIV6_9BURK|nr:hypothetical protein [Cupriavidus nantongensis]AMR78018.1 hypothetical protein A2G96_09835 [Cupriavidus nantongensis]